MSKTDQFEDELQGVLEKHKPQSIEKLKTEIMEVYMKHLYIALKDTYFNGFESGQQQERKDKEDFIRRIKESGIENMKMPTKDVN